MAWYRGRDYEDDYKFFSEDTKQEIHNKVLWLRENGNSPLASLVRKELKEYENYGYDIE